MKRIKRILALVAAVLAAVGMSLGTGAMPALAASGTITVTPPNGTESGTQTTYSLYKVFVASGNGTSISYNTVNTGDVITDPEDSSKILVHSKGWTLPDVESAYNAANGADTFNAATIAHFVFDKTGSVHWGTVTGNGTTNNEGATVYDVSDIHDATGDLPDYAVTAIWDYINNAGDQPIATATATGTGNAQFSGVDNGYYYVTTTSGSAVAVTSNNPNANISDKNSTPTFTKKITGVTKTEGTGDSNTTTATGSIDASGQNAIAETGSTVTYQVTVNFEKGSEKVKLHDTMGTGLTLSGTPTVAFYNGNDTVTVSNAVLYTVRANQDTSHAPDNGDTLTIDFTDDINTTYGITSAIVNYTATVNSDALSSAPAENSAHLGYGDNNAVTGTKHTYVYNAKYTVTKNDGSNAPLAGAGFVLRKAAPATEGTDNYYYYKKNTDGTVSWVLVSVDDNTTYENAAIAAVNNGEITELKTTNSSNIVTFSGLSDGEYELYELTVPSGYMRAENVIFTVDNASSDNALTVHNLEQSTTVINRTGSALPTTGGIGTTIFYVIGGCLVAGAVIVLIARKKKA